MNTNKKSINIQFISALFIRSNKFADDTTSRDSDSLIQEYINVPQTDLYTHCWNHPKIRENWRTVLAAVTLLLIGKLKILHKYLIKTYDFSFTINFQELRLFHWA